MIQRISTLTLLITLEVETHAQLWRQQEIVFGFKPDVLFLVINFSKLFLTRLLLHLLRLSFKHLLVQNMTLQVWVWVSNENAHMYIKQKDRLCLLRFCKEYFNLNIYTFLQVLRNLNKMLVQQFKVILKIQKNLKQVFQNAFPSSSVRVLYLK